VPAVKPAGRDVPDRITIMPAVYAVVAAVNTHGLAWVAVNAKVGGGGIRHVPPAGVAFSAA
jgi:hypothetical protein